MPNNGYAITYSDAVILPLRIQLAVWDMDDSLTQDSAESYSGILAHALIRAGLIEDLNTALTLVRSAWGLPYPEIVLHLYDQCRRTGSDTISVTESHLFDHYNQTVESFGLGHLAEIIPAVRDTTRSLLERLGIHTEGKLALYTLAPRFIGRNMLSAIGLSSHFRMQLFGDELPPGIGKDEPYGWVNLAESFSVKCEHVVGFEDRPEGMLGMLKAGFGHVIIRPSQSVELYVTALERHFRDLSEGEIHTLYSRLSFVREWDCVSLA